MIIVFDTEPIQKWIYKACDPVDETWIFEMTQIEVSFCQFGKDAGSIVEKILVNQTQKEKIMCHHPFTILLVICMTTCYG